MFSTLSLRPPQQSFTYFGLPSYLSNLPFWAITTIFKIPTSQHLSSRTVFISLHSFASYSPPYFPLTYNLHPNFQRSTFHLSPKTTWMFHRLLKLHFYFNWTFHLSFNSVPPPHVVSKLMSPLIYPITRLRKLRVSLPSSLYKITKMNYISLSFYYIIFSPSPIESPLFKPSWSIPSDYFSLLSDFSIFLPIQLVHSTATRGIFLLTSAFKTP